jgi:glycosyltransferase involved in cell wall biosynthesis
MYSNKETHKEQVVCRGRILCLTSSFPKWEGDSSGVFVHHLACDLSRLGWQIDVIAPHSEGVAAIEQSDGVMVYRFRYLWPESLETLCNAGSAVVNLQKNPFNYLKIAPFVASQGLHVLHRVLTGKYDIIHSHWIIPQGLHGMICSMATGIPHVVTVHGGDVFSLNWFVLKFLKSRILNRAQAITVNSNATLRQIAKITCNHTKIYSMPMGISVDAPDPAVVDSIRKKYRAGSGPLLLFVGRLVAEKGVGDIIRAVQILQNDVPGVRALIVGDGQDKAHFVKLSQSLGVSDKVIFIGQVPPSQVVNFYSAADIFLGPSKRGTGGWTEGLGMTFIEAMFAKVPVIASRSGGIIDTVQHERTGLLVNENSPEEIASAVKRLRHAPDLLQKIVENGHALAKEKYSRQMCTQNFSSLFSGMVNRIS